MRDERVYLKTLAGLQPVDVILRRLDDTFCDPLELNQASLLGTAGLLQAVRAGNVSVVNALGSGWLESAALMPFLPALCRRLLDEELALPSAPTWWCGDADSLAYVLDHVEELVVMPMRSGAGRDMVRGDRLSRDERRKMVDMVRARPCEYAAQQHLSLSSLPVWNGVGVQPRQTVLRTYAVAARDTYKVMSGGLTRVSANDGPPVISMQSDSGSKDTWVLCEGEPDTLTLLPPAGQPIALRRSGYDFPSRAGRQSVLDRPPQRARRRAGAPAAQSVDPPQRRIRAEKQHGVPRAVPRCADLGVWPPDDAGGISRTTWLRGRRRYSRSCSIRKPPTACVPSSAPCIAWRPRCGIT